MSRDSQYQLDGIQDPAVHLEQLQSIVLEFDTDCAPMEGQLGCTFYDGLRSLIKFWISKVGRERLYWEE